jgi:hypothetical protein
VRADATTAERHPTRGVAGPGAATGSSGPADASPALRAAAGSPRAAGGIAVALDTAVELRARLLGNRARSPAGSGAANAGAAE